MKDTKRELNLYQLFDYQGVERHLEAMAAKGWSASATPSGSTVGRSRPK